MRNAQNAKTAETVAWLQRRLPGWVVIPAPYHGGYSAFGACTPVSTIIDAADPTTLITQARAAELAAAYGSRPAGPAAVSSHRLPTSP